ncbi:hypothetical protein SBA4_290015 [Candidatus Sulfopaludibacter sp. SbA4]|nr:hypothetical protein SBA4_290015 [Candidatus Sulfopaludibacter sp. SbA4]
MFGINGTANRPKLSSFWTAPKSSVYSRQMEAREAFNERVRREQHLLDRLRTATVHFADALIERA